MFNTFPYRLFFWINFQFILIAALGFTLHEFLKLNSWVFLFIFNALTVMYVSYWSLTPISKAKKYLTQLLKQPRTENLKVEGVDRYQQVFKKGEWIELGELFLQLERKLRRRTKAYLREATELSALMNSLVSPIIAITEKMEVSFLNSSFAVLFDIDLNKYEKSQLSKFDELVNEPELVAALKSALKDQSFEKRHIVIEVDGRKRTFLISMTPLRRQDDQSLYGLVASFSDETLKIELDQKRMDFVSNASHELRTPIAAISSSVSLLQRIDDPEDQKEIIKSLDSNAKRLFQLTQDLLDLSKLEREQEELNLTPCNLKSLTEESLSLISHPEKSLVTISTDVDTFWLDESKVTQVLVNLIRNALIHTPDKTKIYVEWEMEDDFLVLNVEDHGLGLPDEMKSRIFERFYRVDKSRSRKVGGSGIGLSIVKHIMNLHGGEAELIPKNESGGATFKCYFPIKENKLF